MILQLTNAEQWDDVAKTWKPLAYVTVEKYQSAENAHINGNQLCIKFYRKDGTHWFGKWPSTHERDDVLNQFNKLLKKENSMLKTISSDMKSFLVEHKSTIYTIAALFLVDHIFFQGAFRERLHGI